MGVLSPQLVFVLAVGLVQANIQTICTVQPPSTTTFKSVLLENLVNVTREYFVQNSVGSNGFSKVNADQRYQLFDLFAARYDNSASTQSFLAAFLDILYTTSKPGTVESHLSNVIELMKIGDVDSARVETTNAIESGIRAHPMLKSANRAQLTLAEADALAALLNSIFQTIRSELSNNNFEVFMALKVGSTLAFAMDTTGSMAGEIDAAKSRVGAIITETADTTDQPLFFVLSPFNDPTVGPTVTTNSPSIIIAALNSLRASGGGDEPELALSGIYNGLIASSKRSVLFLITDATAKDTKITSRVIAQSIIRKIRIISLLTKNLPSPAGFPLYSRISTSSGGLVTVTRKSDINATTELFRTLTEQGLVKLKISSNLKSVNFIVDSTTSKITIVLTRTSLVGNFAVHSVTNGGSMVPFTVVVNTDELLLLRLNSHTPGMYNLTLTENIRFSVEVSGASIFGGLPTIFEIVSGNLVHNDQVRAGSDATIVVDMFGDLRGMELTEINLVSTAGITLDTIPVSRCGNSMEEYRTTRLFKIPKLGFQIEISGRNTNTNMQFQRVDPCTITPLVADYRILPIPDQVVDAGSFLTISTTFSNKDNQTDVFSFDVSDSRKYISSWTPSSSVSVGSSMDTTLQIVIIVPPGNENGLISKVTVTATATSGEFVFTTFNIIVRNLTIVKCPTLISPKGGRLVCSNFNINGSSCHVVCNPDYTLNGAQQTSCLNGNWTHNNFGCTFVGKKKCKISGDPHYTTFDGKRYDFQGTCIYKAVETTFTTTQGSSYPFSINVENEHRGRFNQRVSWFKKAFVKIGNRTVVFKKRRIILIDGLKVNLPIVFGNTRIQLTGRSVVLTTSFGLKINYDGSSRFFIILSGSYANKVLGLCGNMNSNPNDDLRLASNQSISAKPIDFGNSYKVGGLSAGCQDGTDKDGDGNCTKASEYKALCDVVNTDCFKTCRTIITTPSIVQDCVFDMCVTSGDLQALSQAIAEYAEECQENGAKICDWRKITKLPLDCPSNSHYEHEGTACPNSCIYPQQAARCSKPKISGCVCDNGFVLSGQLCVPLSKCGCTSAGQYYQEGESFLNQDCTERCVCRSTVMRCTTVSCKSGVERCGIDPATNTKSCLPLTTGLCRAQGDPHYKSFDGLRFDFQGNCTYTMVQTTSTLITESFAVRTEHEFRPPNKHGSYVKFVIVEFSHLGRNLKITLGKFNGNTFVSAKIESYFQSTQYLRDYKDVVFTIKRQGGATILMFRDVYIKYTGHAAVVKLPGTYSNKLTGLCGNFNGIPSDDTTTANGTFTKNVNKFGISYQHGMCGTPEPPPAPVCSLADLAKWNSVSYCGVLTAAGTIFSACHAKLNLTDEQADCVFDMCATNGRLSLLHDTLASQIEKCAEVTGPICNWRAALGIAIPTCPSNSTYQGCTSSCPNTCNSPNAEDNCQSALIEGCECDYNHVWSGNRCVLESECGCYPQNIGFVEQGYTKTDASCTQTCSCAGPNKYECKTISCTADQRCMPVGTTYECVPNEAHCFLHGPSYYSTFDGKQYNFDGSCTYILAKSNGIPNKAPGFTIKADKNVIWGIKVPQTKLFIHIAAAPGFGGYNITIHPDGKKVIINQLIWLPGSYNSDVSVLIQFSYTVIQFKFGLVIRVGSQGGIVISVPGILRKQVSGLCGTFDDNPNNDFVMSQSAVVTTNILDFGKSWKFATANDDSCTDGSIKPTTEICQRKQYLPFIKSSCACGYLSSSAEFAECRKKIGVAQYEMACARAACTKYEFLVWVDRMISGYAAECAVRTTTPINTVRPTSKLEFVCPENSQYSNSVPACTPTCSDKTAAKCKAISRLANFVKQEGCVCNAGFIKSGFKCVPENQCGCVADGFYYEHGDIRLTPKCAEKCLCRNSVWACTAEPCLSNQFCGIKSDRFGCHFIDECKTKNGGCSHICSTCNGTSSCKCPTGFGLDVDQKTCKKGLSSGSCSNALSEWKTSYAKWKQGNQDWKKSYNAYVTNSALPQTTSLIDCVEYDPTKPPQNTVYWSKWFDTDNPDGPGDNEMLEKIHNLHPTEVCKSPLAMEKKIVTGPSSTCVLGQIKIRTDEATKGLVCNNADQAAGVVCPDYAVRFLCLK